MQDLKIYSRMNRHEEDICITLGGNEDMMRVFLLNDQRMIGDTDINSFRWRDDVIELVEYASDQTYVYSEIMLKNPDIVVIDNEAPSIDGFEITEWIKDKRPEIDIIMLSNHADSTKVRQAIALGVKDYILKPVKMEDLFHTLQECFVRKEREGRMIEF